MAYVVRVQICPWGNRRYNEYLLPPQYFSPRRRSGHGDYSQVGSFLTVFLMCMTFFGLLLALLMLLLRNKNMRCATPIMVKISTNIRSMKAIMTSNKNGSCDHELKQAWYRFETPYGNRMPETPARTGMCNTMVPFWFSGSHPEYPSLPMPAVACGADQGDTCAYHANIRVQHCGSYMAYYLQPLPRCFMAYCIGERAHRAHETHLALPYVERLSERLVPKGNGSGTRHPKGDWLKNMSFTTDQFTDVT
ncbi:uncharacterized protein LOC144162205 [Haemaphysalis longicornis]